MQKIIFTLSLMLAMTPVFSYAWGPVGHRTVGIIAEQQLTPAARDRVKQLLGKESLAEVANWADGVRGSGKYMQTSWYHFEKIPDSVRYLDNLKSMPDWQKKKAGIVGAILRANEILREGKVPEQEQIAALKFVVHFVGDVHQPLHTGKPDDSGGNGIEINWMGTTMKLHRVWDSGMMYSGHSDFMNPKNSAANDSMAYAKFLNQRPPHVAHLAGDVEAWLNESLALRPNAYDSTYKSNQRQYQSVNLPEIDQRIYAAGVRLAALLNEVFAGQPVSPVERELKKNVEAILGDLSNAISLRP